jgi:hypothetical protein
MGRLETFERMVQGLGGTLHLSLQDLRCSFSFSLSPPLSLSPIHTRFPIGVSISR